MNNTRSNTSGIDVVIDSFQKDLYNALDALYDFEIHAYPRIYKNPRQGGYYPEWYNQQNKNYEDVYLDVSRPFTYFFIDDDNHVTSDGVVYTTQIKVVFIVDLSKVSTTDREDADVHRVVSIAIKNNVFENFNIKGIEKNVPRVFQGLETSKIINSDMHPYHVFAIKGELGYYLTECSNN